MSYTNGIITAPIAASDPYNAMGVNKASNGYDVGYICSNKHGKINKWAKYKPVRYNVNTTDNLPNWWKSKDGDCGLELELNNYLTAYRNNTAYAYKAVRGGETEPYRLCDFVGYNHNAQPFIKTHISKGFMQNINFAYVKNYRFSVEYIETSEDSLVFSDLNVALYGGIDNMFIAADIYNTDPILSSTATPIRSIINSTNITNPSGRMLQIDFNEIDVGQVIYVLLYLKDPTLPMTLPIPYSDDNYMLLSFKINNVVGLSGDLININEKGETNWFSLTGSVTPTNSYSTNYGQKEIQMQIEIKNNNLTPDDIYNYDFRLRVVGTDINNTNYEKIITPTFLNKMNGSTISHLELPSAQTVTTYIACDRLFEEYINKPQNKMVNIYLDAKLTSSNEYFTIANRGLFIKE